jgi:aspartyl-tRNA(Asn)/glutamyl-tRNA(Gln) amidotransferase subunit A
MDEFAMGSSTENSAYGPTFHPQDIRRVPGGSSGGSAAAVASGMVPIALGSDTGGSARQPAAFCGVVGFKPSYGRFSRYGLVSFASSLDCVATLSTSVQEAALLTEIMAGPDPLDASSVDHPPAPWLNACTRGIAGYRIGVLSDLEGITPGVQAALLQTQVALQAAGAQLEPIALPSLGLALACYCVLAPAEASSNLARFDGIRYGAAVESEDLMTRYLQTRSQGFGPEVQRRILLGTFVLSAGYQDRYYLRAQALRQQITQELEIALQQYDLLLCPTTPSVAFLLEERHQKPLSMYQSDILTVPASLSGLPAISVPCGQSEGLPVGAQLIGRRFDEASVFAGATVIEWSQRGQR